MAYYGAYYSLFKNDLKHEANQIRADPKDEILLQAWNYPNVK